MELTVADRNGQKDVTLGDVVTVRLPETPTTGFRWIPDVDQDRLRLVSDRYEVSSPTPGASGLHSFEFRPLQVGDVALHLVLRRPWEEVPPSDDYRVDLRVRN